MRLILNSHRLTVSSAVLLICLLSGCQQYGEVSPRAYEISTSLYSICNRHDVGRITAAETTINSSYEAAEITEAEQQWLQDIVDKARADEWTTAMQDARTMMMEQVE